MLKKQFIINLILIVTLFFFMLLNNQLAVFVLFPLFFIPYFYSGNDIRNANGLIFVFCVTLIYLVFILKYFSIEMIVLGLIQILFFTCLAFYRLSWDVICRKEEKAKQIAFRDLRAFNHKYRSRIDSLKHLEKQVAGLLELFEISRDFSEYLSYGGIAGILQKRVRPHIPFESLQLLIVSSRNTEGGEKILRFTLGDDVKQDEEPLQESEKLLINRLKGSKTILQEGPEWVFPLILDDDLLSLLIVKDAQSDDLAKLEVLSAFLALQIKKIHLYDAVKELAIRDGLTGVFLRRHFLERMEEEVKRSDKYQLPMAVLMLDIDHFKRYNDDFGHLAGDATLKQVAAILLKNVRKVDIVARYGGEEFIVLIPETRKEGALEIAERIRSNIARNVFSLYNNVTRMTVSIGVALYSEENARKFSSDGKEKVFKLIQNADKALYQAKEEGRNQVVLFRDDI